MHSNLIKMALLEKTVIMYNWILKKWIQEETVELDSN